jgi:hypothetical protein
MGRMLLGLAGIAALALAVPASADPGFVPQGPLQGAAPPSGFSGGGGHGHHGGGRGGGGGGNGVWVNGGEWARYNNQSFASDSFNGWWHDRPDRAYPAWMRNNQDCARQWYAGATLRC